MAHTHFDDKTPLSHVVERRALGILSLSESHGTEIPGHLSAAADAMRETAFLVLLIWLPLKLLQLPLELIVPLLIGCAAGLLIWKTGRSAWLGWARLERLHRLIMQEREEIESNRPQEREELKVIYAAKGLEGRLLEEVLDVLMADNDRLLKVMLEEELGLTLQAYEHPLKQSFGAFWGTCITFVLTGSLYALFPSFGVLLAAFLAITLGASISAIYEKNRFIASLVWNVAIATVAIGCTYFLLSMWVRS